MRRALAIVAAVAAAMALAPPVSAEPSSQWDDCAEELAPSGLQRTTVDVPLGGGGLDFPGGLVELGLPQSVLETFGSCWTS